MGRLIRKSRTDLLVFVLFVLMVHVYLWCEVCLVIPSYHTMNTTTVLAHYAVLAWLYFHIMTNAFALRLAQSSGTTAARKAHRKAFWEYCVRCADHFPPRSHHCVKCDMCVLRHNHHCQLLGCCVGAANQRHYMVAVTYIGLASVYVNALNFWFVGETQGGYGPWTWLCLALPHVMALTGMLSALQLFVCVVTSLAYVGSFLTLWHLRLMLVQIGTGQTRYERHTKLREYDRGMPANLYDVLGPRWYLAWVWPWVTSEPTDDGMSYKEVLSKCH